MRTDEADSAVQDVDYLVIGSGLAGLTFALRTVQHGSTLILTKKDRAESSTNYAQGGIACAVDDDDVRLHAQDTLVAGAGLCHADAVDVLVREGPKRVRELIGLGAQFSLEEGPSGAQVLSLGREGGHSRNRIVHAVDRTGWECERALLAAAKGAERLRVLEHYFVADLLMSGDGPARRCIGAVALDTATGDVQVFRARAVLLATGGCGRIYEHTTNPSIATGDGVAMAWRAGATIANMEFIQFHPTALCHPGGQSFLISEAVRGEGGVLRTADGATFMEKYHPLKDLAPRDIVARAIHAERTRRSQPCVYLDVTHLDADFLRARFPTIYARCMDLGIDITRQPIPVVPAAHYTCGGVLTDLHGRSTVPGLYGAGEVACTGVHGANRLASNSLLEALVYGRRAADAALEEGAPLPQETPQVAIDGRTCEIGESGRLRARLRHTMHELVGIVRNDRDLAAADDAVREIDERVAAIKETYGRDPDVLELGNMTAVAKLIVRSAIGRKESRGLQYTTDYPETDDEHWLHDTCLNRGEAAPQ